VSDQLTITDAAQAFLAAGLCALPAIRAEKRPAVGRWKQYQQRLPTPAELSAWLANAPDGICILCGQASGNVEIIDFDAGGELFAAWWRRVPADLRERLVVERTPSGGWHVVYRCQVPIRGNMKLAQRRDGTKVVTLIETRGEGGLFLCAPTPGYEVTQGDLCELPVLTEAERDTLLQAAWELNEYVPPVVNGPPGSANVGQRSASSAGQRRISTENSDIGRRCPTDNGHHAPTAADRPGDDFNHRGDVRAVLEQHGWVRLSDRQGRDGNEYWRRPGKESGWSATLKDRVFFVFSSNAVPFEPNQAYAPFSVYALLNHGGDFEQAARSLRELGYRWRFSGGQRQRCGHLGHCAIVRRTWRLSDGQRRSRPDNGVLWRTTGLCARDSRPWAHPRAPVPCPGFVHSGDGFHAGQCALPERRPGVLRGDGPAVLPVRPQGLRRR
jgi:hypothetical protein